MMLFPSFIYYDIYEKKLDIVMPVDFEPNDVGSIYSHSDNPINEAIVFHHYEDITVKIQPTCETGDEP